MSASVSLSYDPSINESPVSAAASLGERDIHRTTALKPREHRPDARPCPPWGPISCRVSPVRAIQFQLRTARAQEHGSTFARSSSSADASPRATSMRLWE